MPGDSELRSRCVLAARCRNVAAALAACAVVLVLIASLVPIDPEVNLPQADARRVSGVVVNLETDLQPLLKKIADINLMRSPEVKAAVKDTGAAQRLAAKLTLHGVTKVRGKYAAYIQIGKDPAKPFGTNDKLLKFVVERIEPGIVILMLEGVQVKLTH